MLNSQFCRVDMDDLHQLMGGVSSSLTADQKVKKQALEDLATYLLSCVEPFEVAPDIRTQTNQLDQVVAVRPINLFHPFLQWIGLHFLAECKNESEPVDVRWIGKVQGLLVAHDMRFAILFSRMGMTKDARDLQRSFRMASDKYIIDVSLEDITDMVMNGMNFLTLLERKTATLRLLTTKPVDLDKLYAEED